MEDRIRIIVGILADTDAVFAPNRKWKRPRPTVIYEHRRDYPAGGVPWRSDAHDEAGRKAAQRQLEALCGEGLVKTYRPKRVKTLGAKLTEAGETLARAVCALPDVERSIGGVMHAAMAMDTPEAGENWDRRIWIPETLLAGTDYQRCAADADERCKLFEFAEVLYPALNRGWIISNSSIQGHVWYSPTPAGLPPDDIFIRSLESHLDWPVQLASAYILEHAGKSKPFDLRVQRWMTDQDWTFVRTPHEEWVKAVDNMAKTLAYIWANRLIFYKALRARFPDLPRLELRGGVKTADAALGAFNALFARAVERSGDYEPLLMPEARDWATELVFHPVNHTARRPLTALPIHRVAIAPASRPASRNACTPAPA